ncbi:hypothetical protein WJX73_007827 [Symbiochloris irregularis]|uniref:Plastid lipid-associated protein/fibrillin conserved domain-containing protein n=1 Tax=Symbiochloris irregularis TaxID=706552 RepID=A0AAW1NLX8_9CHLO
MHTRSAQLSPSATLSASTSLQRRPAARQAALQCRCLLSRFFPQQLKKPPELKALLDAIEGTNRGFSTTKEQKATILSCVEALEQIQRQSGRSTDISDGVNAVWKMLWTSEKETQFILKNAPLFRTQAGDVFQMIDKASGRLQNAILFPPAGCFLIDSSCEADGDARINFKFNKATFRVSGKDYNLPPFGQGWFETIYLQDDVRVAKDSRKDTIVFVRDGLPRDLSQECSD